MIHATVQCAALHRACQIGKYVGGYLTYKRLGGYFTYKRLVSTGLQGGGLPAGNFQRRFFRVKVENG